MKRLLVLLILIGIVVPCAYASPHIEGAGAVTMYDEPAYIGNPIIQVYSNMPVEVFKIEEACECTEYDWAYIGYTLGNKHYYGFVNADYISYGEVEKLNMCALVNVPEGIYLREAPTYDSRKLALLKYLSEVVVRYACSEWFYVTAKVNGVEWSGYVANYIEHKVETIGTVIYQSLIEAPIPVIDEQWGE